MTELFDLSEYIKPLTPQEKKSLVDKVIRNAQLGVRYMYKVKETAGLLHITYDEIQTLIAYYKLDAITVLTTIRIPWWSLCEYLIDPADDLDSAFKAYLNSLPHKKNDGGKK